MASAPIRFHHVHGENIAISDDGSEATRLKEYGGAVCFTRRPLEPGEQLVLKVTELWKGWRGNIRLGVSDVRPNALEEGLPRFLCPDLDKKARIWGKILDSEDDPINFEEEIVIFFEETQGKLLIRNGDSEPREFIRGVLVTKPVYLIFDVYGEAKSICIDSKPDGPPPARLMALKAGRPPRSMIFRNMNLIPAFLASYESERICISSDSASLQMSLAKSKKEDFAVTETALMSNSAIVIRIDGIKVPGPMKIVLTTEDPAHVYSYEKIDDLLADANSISFETESLRVHYEIAIAISRSGYVYMSLDNIKSGEYYGQVDPNLKYYVVLGMRNVSRLSPVGIAMLDSE